MLLWKVQEILAERGIPVTRGGGSWLAIDTDRCQVIIEARPIYCDRGNFLVQVFPRGDLALAIDSQDGFPRYYFGVAACTDEVTEWMRVRGVWP